MKEIEDNHYQIGIKEAEWLVKALNKDESRPALTQAALAYYGRSVVLVTTDTHRMHILRLGDYPESFDTRLIDLRRVVYEARYYKAKVIEIDGGLNSVRLRIKEDGAERVNLHTPVVNTVPGTFARFDAVIPKTTRPVSEFYAISSKYLADATLLSRLQDNRVIAISEDARKKPIAFRGTTDIRWLAVVMPMSLEGFEEKEYEGIWES